MKTISRNKSGLFSALLVLGGFAALYLYRRQGGKLKPLLSRGGEILSSAREKINSMAPEATATGVTSRSRAHEIPTAPEDLDRYPSV